ncbi:GIY-YIG nuclease family protein [Neorhizobium galegae]|nr:GIY-YIG nuclease family protein [Neorhizobium galegae]
MEMTKADQIRALAADGLEVAEIARRLDIRYQQAYNVLKGRNRSASIPDVVVPVPIALKPMKPRLPVETLIAGGGTLASRWLLSADGDLVLDMPVPKAVGVYSFVKDEFAIYVGVATVGISKRLYTYGKPGVSQRTNIRLNGFIKKALGQSGSIDIYVATPPDMEWNGLPVHGAAGVELGLINKYMLPWNMRSAG